MKKVLSISLVLVFALAVLVGCGGGAADTLEADLQEFVDGVNEFFDAANTELMHTTAEVRDGVSVAYRFFIGEVEDVESVIETTASTFGQQFLDDVREVVSGAESVVIEIVDDAGHVLGYREIR